MFLKTFELIRTNKHYNLFTQTVTKRMLPSAKQNENHKNIFETNL